MKILYYGGQKSGKSRLAEERALILAGDKKPFYIATYDNSYSDKEMEERVARHKAQRKTHFTTIETPMYLSNMIEENNTYLIDCMSMWILNTLSWQESDIIAHLDALEKKKAHLVFVLNDVSSGVIPIDQVSRNYVDRSGIVGQRLAAICDEVYEVKLGLTVKLK